MKQPFFSIIIPTLNEEHYVPTLLQDLEKQKEKNFEVIVVDSSSHDKTKEAVLRFTKLQLRFFENELKNVSIQRNFGAKHAHGSYLVFLDADTQVESLFTRKLEKAIIQKKGLFFIPKLKTDDPDTEAQYIMDIVNYFFIISLNLNRPFALGGGMILEKNYFQTIGGFDEKLGFGEDYEIARRSISWGVRAKHLNDVSVIYSLRRIRKEGKLLAYYKFFMSTMQYLIRGKTEKKLFEYEMGGHIYSENSKSEFSDYFKKLLKKTEKTFIKLLKE